MNDLERIEQELRSIRLTPTKSTDERILTDASRALSQSSQPIESWGTRLAGRWARAAAVAAAAVLLLSVLVEKANQQMERRFELTERRRQLLIIERPRPLSEGDSAGKASVKAPRFILVQVLPSSRPSAVWGWRHDPFGDIRMEDFFNGS